MSVANDTDDQPLPVWARVAVYLFGSTVGGCALAASGFDLFGLALALGFALGTCLAVPIGLDAGAITCGVRWITAPPGRERTRWRNATLGLVGVSAALNGVSVLAAPHWLANGLRQVADISLLPGRVAVLIAVLVAVAFPLVAAWMVHAILQVRDKAARHHQPRRRTWRNLMTAWAERVRQITEDHRADRQARRAVLLAQATSSSQEEIPPSDRSQEPTSNPAGDTQEDPAGDSRDTEPEPPALTGHKMNDARNWYRHERQQGRTPLPVDVNRWIGSEGYVKSRHVEGWDEELRKESGETTGPLPSLRAVHG